MGMKKPRHRMTPGRGGCAHQRAEHQASAGYLVTGRGSRSSQLGTGGGSHFGVVQFRRCRTPPMNEIKIPPQVGQLRQSHPPLVAMPPRSVRYTQFPSVQLISTSALEGLRCRRTMGSGTRSQDRLRRTSSIPDTDGGARQAKANHRESLAKNNPPASRSRP